MPYSAITSAEIQSGEPITETLFGKVRGNFSDHETRISSLETSIGAYKPIEFYVQGNHWLFGAPQSLIGFQRIPFDLTLLSGKLTLLDTGTAGNLEVDVLFKRGSNPFASIFSVKPILAFGSSQFAINTGVLSTTAMLANDILALSITQAMTNCTEFLVEVQYQI